MKKMAILCTVFIASIAHARMPQPMNISDTIEKMINNTLPTTDVGISVIDAQTGKTLYERQSYQSFTPASNTKLFSAAAALYGLGPKFTFKTSIKANPSKIKNKQLNSDLYVKFNGDPSLRVNHIKKLFSDAHKKVHQITGNIIVDDTYFSGPIYGPGWSQEDLHWYFNAPVTSIIINQNNVDVDIIPGSRLGMHAKLRLVDKDLSPFFKVKSDVKTVTYRYSQRHCSLNPKQDNNNIFSITGCWPISNKAKTLHLSVINPRLTAKQIIRRELKRNNIKFTGNIQFGKTPKNAQIIAYHTSRPLDFLLRTLLKDSNNIYAEAFTKTLGKKITGTGSLQEGVNTIKNILYKKTNIDFSKMVLKDGCGASRYTLITPNQMSRLLFVVQHSPKVAKIFKQALPESGHDGTLKHRMKSFDLQGKLHAKTGSMTGVSTLSGYMTTRDNHHLIFSIMINHIVGSINEGRMLQAQIASVLYSGIDA